MANTGVVLVSTSAQLNPGPVEVQVRTRGRGTALILVPGTIDGRTVRVLRGGARTEQA